MKNSRKGEWNDSGLGDATCGAKGSRWENTRCSQRGAKESPGPVEDSQRRVWPTEMSQETRPASREILVPAGTIWNNRPRAEETHLSWQGAAALRDLSTDPP